jgi:hypothetical protein
MPSSKVSAATIAAALSTIGFWLLGEYAGVHPPELVQAAVVTLLTLAVGYAVPENRPAPSAVRTIRGQRPA